MSLKSASKPKFNHLVREESFIEPEINNPFSHKCKLSLVDLFKIGFNTLFLAPVRAVSFCLVFSIFIFTSTLITINLTDDDLKKEPLKGWRRSLRNSLKFIGKAIKFCVGFHYVKVNGKPATKQEATIFVAAPHSTFFDIFIGLMLPEMPCGVSKVEISRIPIVGRFVRAIQPILVTREDSKKKMAVIEEIKRRSGPSSDWPQILIFPEGTCTNRSCLIKFKPGAFIPGLPVQPILVEYKNKFDCVTWSWDGLSAIQIIYFTLCQFHTYLEITFLPVYSPSNAEKEDADLYANRVRALMAKCLKIPQTDHSFEDCRLMDQARKLKLPFDTGIIEFSKLKEKLGIRYENCERILNKYTDITKKSTHGKISLKEFCDYLELPPSNVVKQVFNLYDRNHNGTIDFREFTIGLSLLTQPANKEETLRLAFRLFDKDGKGHIKESDLETILLASFAMKSNQTKKVFEKIDKNHDGLITFEEFKEFTCQKPELARVFLSYHESQSLTIEEV